MEKEYIKMLETENNNLRKKGIKLAEAASRVIDTYDGLHRLALAVSDCYKQIADENGRAKNKCLKN